MLYVRLPIHCYCDACALFQRRVTLGYQSRCFSISTAGKASVALIEARREQNKVIPYSESLGTCYRQSMARRHQYRTGIKYIYSHIQQINMQARLSSADPNKCRHVPNASTRGPKP
jgi:hypothetical protein